MGGRWNISMENGLSFDLSGISYGGQIDCYEIRGSEQYEEGQILEKELQIIWTNHITTKDELNQNKDDI
jgi:hypothetical protein